MIFYCGSKVLDTATYDFDIDATHYRTPMTNQQERKASRPRSELTRLEPSLAELSGHIYIVLRSSVPFVLWTASDDRVYTH